MAEHLSIEVTQKQKGTIMPKIKTNRGAAKRFSSTGAGKIKRHHCNASHILTKKSSKRKRELRKGDYISHADMANVKRLVPSL